MARPLSGAAPVLGEGTCRIVDNGSDGPNGNLVFTSLDRRCAPAPVRPAPVPVAGPGCVTGVNTTLNVRAGPGTGFGRSGEIPAGACGIEVLDRCEDGFCVVRHGTVVGWTSMRYVRR